MKPILLPFSIMGAIALAAVFPTTIFGGTLSHSMTPLQDNMFGSQHSAEAEPGYEVSHLHGVLTVGTSNDSCSKSEAGTSLSCPNLVMQSCDGDEVAYSVYTEAYGTSPAAIQWWDYADCGDAEPE